MKRQRFAVALLLLLAGTALAAETWISAKAIDLVRYLPPPPAPDSEAQRRDLAAVLAIQATRTEAQVREAQDDQQVSIFSFADVLGSGFFAERLPRTAKLAQRACGQTSLVTAAAKRFWNRPRPYLVSAEVRRVIENVTEGSYPSGHATCGLPGASACPYIGQDSVDREVQLPLRVLCAADAERAAQGRYGLRPVQAHHAGNA